MLTSPLRPLIRSNRASALPVLAGLLLAGLLAAPAATMAATVERVEPPFWWQGMAHSELQVLLYGPGIGAFRAEVSEPGVTVARSVSVNSPNYLFVYLQIDPQQETRSITILLRNDHQVMHVPYQLRARNADPSNARGLGPADAIYLVTPDRFVNGDPDNDNVDGFGDSADRSQWGGRHGGDLAGISSALDYIADLGFTALWLNPVLENAMPGYSYHGYSTTDFYRVDPRYGSNENYRALADQARDRGIGLVMDMIVNHIGSGHWWMDDLPARDWINFGAEYTQTNHERVALWDPYRSEHDLKRFSDGWFDRTMPDLNQRNPLLADYLVQNAIWWIESLGLAAIRLDTYPYPDKHYMTEWTRRIMREYPKFMIFGEEWSLHPAAVSYWQRGKANHDGYRSWLPGLKDFPLREALQTALTADTPEYFSAWTPLYQMLTNDFLYPDPMSLVIFPDNHDMSRIFTQVGEDRDLLRMALVYVATMRGIPQIYYGTEVLMSNRGSDDHGLIRSDFPGGWPGDRVNALTGQGLSEAQKATQKEVRRLFRWRREHPEVANSQLMHFVPSGPVYTYFRFGDQHSVLVSFNRSAKPVSLPLGQYAERLDGYTRGRDVLSGKRYELSDGITMLPMSSIVVELE